MSDMNVSNVSNSVASYQVSAQAKTPSDKKEDVKAKQNTKAAANEGVVFEKSDEKKPATYSINKMSPEDRANLVSQLKADQENRQSQLLSLVSKMMTGQATAVAQSDESMWQFLASGKFTVDPATKAQAQQDISEDGYWGVKQTSQRMFDFASALAGDDVEKMKEMQAAMEKGFKQATKTWGRELPSISQETMKAANQLFEDYYASKNVITE